MRHIMMRFAHGRRSRHHATASNLAVWACLLALLAAGLVAVGPSAASAAQAPVSGVAASSLPFAIADFDGDLRPDIASIQSVQSGQSDPANDSSYWIQLQLSSSGRRLIRLDAPAGGLVGEGRGAKRE